MVTSKIESFGDCVYCKKSFTHTTINRHLATHLAAMQAEKKDTKAKSFLLSVTTPSKWGKSGFFLSLLADSNTMFGEIDGFLRGIWLECCGHLSGFNLPAKRRPSIDPDSAEQKALMALLKTDPEKFSETMNAYDAQEIDMNTRLGKVLHKGLKLTYDYDYGSTTELDITVYQEFAFNTEQSGLKLLSRNNPMFFPCSRCGKEPSGILCSEHIWSGNGNFCTACAKIHKKECPEFGDYAEMKLVNSPRAGVCGYKGGFIDKARDGVYKNAKAAEQ